MMTKQWGSKKFVRVGLVSLLSGVALLVNATRLAMNPNRLPYLAAQNKVTMINHLEKELRRSPETGFSAAQEEHMQHVLGDYRRLQSELQEQRSTEAYARGKATNWQVDLFAGSGLLLQMYGGLSLWLGLFKRQG